ncbi:MAG TPA: DNA-processing protein DprA [Solirubrobacteraceae bacterium]|jgi:DNA processing protein|nr:DNA-processing protein DprA [Solirubrobacteraceae bacterium]
MRRTWLLGRISAYLNFQRKRLEEILSLSDENLIDLWQHRVDDDLDREYREFSACHAEAARARAEAAGLELLCQCDQAYPESLGRLWTPPAVLHVAGGMERFLELARADPVAVVGSRRATEYGQGVALALGRGISASGLCVVSGLAGGVDAYAHRGALAAGGHTVGVLAGCAAEPYPKGNGRLYGEIRRSGAIVSEFGPGTAMRDWTFIARNRIIAGLSRLTVLVQAREGSGAGSTVRFARRLGDRVGAVPGAVTVSQSELPNRLLAERAVVIRDAQDVLDAVFGAGMRDAASADRAALNAEQLALLEAIASGADTVAALSRTGVGGGEMLVTLAELELAGCVRRAAGGRYLVVA